VRDALIKKGYDIGDVTWNPERNVHEMMIKAAPKPPEDDFSASMAAMRPVKIGRGFVHSSNYQKSLMLYKKIKENDHPPFKIMSVDEADDVRKESNDVVMDDKKDVLKYLLQEAKKGLNIQRYKGLGEMNPEQLWQTTMNPANRAFFQVKVEDAVDADEIFTILMGDVVEPRREFIQSHALEVSVLDI
jgi:DNA gyrase subunit B